MPRHVGDVGTRSPSPTARVMALPASYAVLRCVQLIALGINALLLARVLGLHQYALYARGAFFATAFTAVGFFGQDQLAYRHRIASRILLKRTVGIVTVVFLATSALAICTTARANWPTIISSCVGTAGIAITTVRFLAAQIAGRDDHRAIGQLLNTVSVQVSGVVAAYLGGGAFVATTTATAISWLWVAGTIRQKQSVQVRKAAPFREGVAVGIGGIAYASIPAIASIIVAIRATDAAAAEDRFLLLAFSALLGMAGALNSEYFRARLFHPDVKAKAFEAVKIRMIKVNVATVCCAVSALCVAGLLARYVIPVRYGSVGGPLIALSAVVPISFGSVVLFNLELARGRMARAIGRNVAAAIAALVAMLVVTPTPYHLVAVVVSSEACGLAVFAVAALWPARDRLS